MEKIIDGKTYELVKGMCRECAFYSIATCAALTQEDCLTWEAEGKVWREKE